MEKTGFKKKKTDEREQKEVCRQGVRKQLFRITATASTYLEQVCYVSTLSIANRPLIR